MNNLKAALEFADLGWHVFPCKPSKAPYTQHGKDDATINQEKIRSWWNRWPDALIGVYCEKSGFFAVDIDNKDGRNGARTWADLVKNLGGGEEIKPGPTQTTPSGGWHLLFSLPEKIKIPNTANKLGPGLDLRSNGYIIVAPSDGYKWIEGYGPKQLLECAPDWLLQQIQDLDKKKTKENQGNRSGAPAAADAGEYWLNHYLNLVSVGSRNNTGFELALQLRDSGLSQTEAESYLTDYSQRVPGDGYTKKEALASLQQAYKAPAREPARLPGLAYSYNGSEPLDLSQAPEVEPQDIDQILLYEAIDHEGHARCLVALHAGMFAFSEHLGWIFYNSRFWQRNNAELKAERAIVETLKARRLLAVKNNQEGQFEKLIQRTSASSSNVLGTKRLLSSLVAADVSEFDSDPNLLNVNNGVVDLRTSELLPHSRDQKFTYCLPVDFDPEAPYDRWFQFLLEATSFKEDLVDFLKQAVGYSLTGYTWEEILFYIYGPARAGKGTFTETLIHMLGNKPLSTEAGFETFTADRYGDTQNFDLAPLKPCRFVAASESNKKQPLNPAKIKQLTGGNFIYCAYKHREHFSYRPQFKIWLSSNHPANVDVDDDAAWSRVKVIEFPISRVGHEDKRLKQDLANDENLRGVLRWAVEGAREWYDAENGLQFPKSIADATKAQRESQDFVQQFLTEMTTESQKSWVHTGALWESYKSWCDSNGVPAKYQNQFSQALRSKGYELGREYNAEQKRIRVVRGLKLK